MLYHSPPLPSVRFEPFAPVLPVPPVLSFRLGSELYYGLFSSHLCLAFSVVQLDAHGRQRIRVLLNDLRELLDMAVVSLRPFRPFLPMDIRQLIQVINKDGKEYPRYPILRQCFKD